MRPQATSISIYRIPAPPYHLYVNMYMYVCLFVCVCVCVCVQATVRGLKPLVYLSIASLRLRTA